MKSLISVFIIGLIAISCSTSKQVNESDTTDLAMSGNALIDAQNLSDHYAGEKDILRRAESLLMPLVLKNDVEALSLMTWIERKKGYINDNIGYTSDSLLNASKYLKKALELNPQNPTVKIAEIGYLVDSKKYPEASTLIGQLKNDLNKLSIGNKFRLYLYSSNMFLMQKKYKEALLETENCLKFSSGNTIYKSKCVSAEALSYRYLGMHDKSIEKHSEAYDLSPTRWSRGNLALALLDAGRFESGIRILEAMNTKDETPDSYFSMLNLAYLRYANSFAKTSPDKGIEYYRKIDYKKSDDVEILESASSNLLYHFNNPVLSLEFTKRALELEPNSPKANFLMAEHILYSSKDFPKSLTYYLKAKDNLNRFVGSVDPRVVMDVYWRLGALYSAYLPEKNFDLSIQYYTMLQEAMKKLKRNERIGEMYFGFARVYHQRGWETKNLRDSELALEYYKKSSDVGYEKDLSDKNIRVVMINIQNFKNKKI